MIGTPQEHHDDDGKQLHFLREEAVLEKLTKLDPKTDTEAAREILTDARSERLSRSNTPQERRRFRRAREKRSVLLTRTGIAKPLLDPDWLVERTLQQNADALGIRSFQALQSVLAQQYRVDEVVVASEDTSQFIHIHKGPGSGAAMAELAACEPATSESHSSVYWEHFGIGDKLYFLIEKILQKFVLPQKKNDHRTQQFIQLLGLALRRELKKRYGNEPFDLNVIYALLAEPKTWIREWYEEHHEEERASHKRKKHQAASSQHPTSGRYKSSREFEDDSFENFDEEVFERFLIFQGDLSPDEISRRMDARRERKRREYAQRLGNLKRRKRLSAEKMMEKTELEEKLETIEAIDEAIKARREFRPPDREPLTTPEFLSRIFSKRFVESVVQAGGRIAPKPSQTPDAGHSTSSQSSPSSARQKRPPLDLHRHAHFHHENFVPGFFTQMSEKFPKASAHLITAVRSDSHESDEDFEKDIAGNLQLLAPGGILLTEGTRQSYTRIQRFEHALRAIQNLPNPDEFRAEVVLDAKTREPISLLIQRAKNSRKSVQQSAVDDRFLTAIEKRACFADHVTFEPLEKIAKRPDIVIGNQVRRAILQEAHGDKNIFRGLHDEIRKRVKGVMKELGN